MISNYDVHHNEDDQASAVEVPNYEKNSTMPRRSFKWPVRYDHLTEVLNKILAERPENIVDFFEEYSRKVKERRFKPLTDHLEDIYVPPGRYDQSKKLMPLLKALPPAEPSTVDPEDLEMADMSSNNLLELNYYLEYCGIGLPRIEIFWGKIFGTLKNYLVVETDLKEDEYMKRNETYNQDAENPPEATTEDAIMKGEGGIAEALSEIAKVQQLAGEGDDTKYPRPLPPKPVIIYEEPPEPPPEPSGVGVNKKVYYVCTDIGEPWIQLPDLKPKHIRVSRQIIKSFTGNLEEPILTYPEFPGTEKDYLRSQIARISAGTQISPLGYYTFGGEGGGEGDEDEEAEEAAGGGEKTDYKINPKYEPPH
ncbi:hypothetical protein NQ317_015541 [Molorchus minor]|uniref:Uncharacterized protein n=1 Tax=Molorchus minor TaxID=1323400 RepID=A0ABQ9JQS5_9CUCU|nr:hypothetical protein NQ317_015541 [Molorchus minor]